MRGKSFTTSSRALGPPVEAAMATTRRRSLKRAPEPVLIFWKKLSDKILAAVFSPACAAAGLGSSLALAASFIFTGKLFLISSCPSPVKGKEGLVTKSTAPLASASRVASLPSRVRLLTMITGLGEEAIILFKVSSPSILGISRSRVITSGLRRSIFFKASSPLRAVPARTSWGSCWMISPRKRLIKAESSTTITRSFCIPLPLGFENLKFFSAFAHG